MLCRWAHLGMDFALALDLLLLDGGAVAGPPMEDGSLEFSTCTDAGLLGRLVLTDYAALDGECGEGEAAADPRAPGTSNSKVGRWLL